MTVYLRVCPDCGEEYQPHMTTCVECGGVLRDKLDDGSEEGPPAPAAEPSLPPGEYRRVADGLSSATLEPLVALFAAQKVPVKVESHGYGLRLSARKEDRAAVIAILVREGVIPAQPDESAPAVATDGGPCPACGTTVAAGSAECPDCGLQLAGASSCESCGMELPPDAAACPDCGQALD